MTEDELEDFLAYKLGYVAGAQATDPAVDAVVLEKAATAFATGQINRERLDETLNAASKRRFDENMAAFSEASQAAQDMNNAPITQDEMIEMFGETMPIEAVNLLWNAAGDRTLGELRNELRAIAAKHVHPEYYRKWMDAELRLNHFKAWLDPTNDSLVARITRQISIEGREEVLVGWDQARAWIIEGSRGDGPRQCMEGAMEALYDLLTETLHVMTKPKSYHDLYITTAEIERASIFDLAFNCLLTCTHAGGWELWLAVDDTGKREVAAGEYDTRGLRLDIDGYVICDSLTPKEEPAPETTPDE